MPRVDSSTGRKSLVVFLTGLMAISAASCVNGVNGVEAGVENQTPSPTSPTSRVHADGPVYESLTEALESSSVVVEGEVVAKISSAMLPGDNSGTTWMIYKLEVHDDLQSASPPTIAIVDFDREAAIVESSTPAISIGQQGLFLLNTADRPGQLIFPEFGETYYPVEIFLEVDGLFVDPEGRIEAFGKEDAMILAKILELNQMRG